MVPFAGDVERQDLDAAAQFADLGLDDVHADAAAGDLVDFGRGRETGRKISLISRPSSATSSAPSSPASIPRARMRS